MNWHADERVRHCFRCGAAPAKRWELDSAHQGPSEFVLCDPCAEKVGARPVNSKSVERAIETAESVAAGQNPWGLDALPEALRTGRSSSRVQR